MRSIVERIVMMSENTRPNQPDQEAQKPASEASRDAEAARFFRLLNEKMLELMTTGMPEGRAEGIAMLEHRITAWPPEWGNELIVLLYGDFVPPAKPLHFAELGIVVEAEKITHSIVKNVMCVLRARVKVKERSIAGVVDAVDRINTLLGIAAVVAWGNCGSGWWSLVTHGTLGGVLATLDDEDIEHVTNHMKKLPPKVVQRIKAALYWIREPRQMVMERYRLDVMRTYAGYWNAFECLVDAVCLLKPQPKVSKNEKQDRMNRFLAERRGKRDSKLSFDDPTQNWQTVVSANFVGRESQWSVEDIIDCHHSFVSPGFVGKASYALRVCFPPEQAERYILECFKAKPCDDRLYNIRNAINHGDIDAENPHELIRVEDKHLRLWMIVFGMLGTLIPIKRPLDPD